MIAPLAHVAGIPVEETALAFGPFAAAWLGVLAATVRRRRRPRRRRYRTLRRSHLLS